MPSFFNTLKAKTVRAADQMYLLSQAGKLVRHLPCFDRLSSVVSG